MPDCRVQKSLLSRSYGLPYGGYYKASELQVVLHSRRDVLPTYWHHTHHTILDAIYHWIRHGELHYEPSVLTTN